VKTPVDQIVARVNPGYAPPPVASAVASAPAHAVAEEVK